MRRWNLGLALFCLALQAWWVNAAEVSNIYQESVLVPSQGAADRRSGASEAMAQVLVRLSGTTAVLQNPDIKAALRSADRYLRQFSYTREKMPVEGATGEEPEMVSGYRLSMDFQPRPLNDLLKRTGQPVWSVNRPQVLVWVQYTDTSDTSTSSEPGLLNSNAAESTTEALDEASRRRGIPIALPAPGQGGNATAYAQANGSDVVLSGEMRVGNGGCSAQWQMDSPAGSNRWGLNGTNVGECIDPAIDGVAELLSAQYAFTASGTSEAAIRMEVTNINNFEDYGQVLLLLKSLALVEVVDVISVEGDQVSFSLASQAASDRLQRAIRLKRVLIEEPVQGLEESPTLRYRYAPPEVVTEPAG